MNRKAGRRLNTYISNIILLILGITILYVTWTYLISPYFSELTSFNPDDLDLSTSPPGEIIILEGITSYEINENKVEIFITLETGENYELYFLSLPHEIIIPRKMIVSGYFYHENPNFFIVQNFQYQN